MTKVRISKKLLALATAILMLVVMVLPVAAGPGTGQITVHKLAGNSMTGAMPNHTGEQQSIPTGFSPLAGAEFTLYRLPESAIDTINNAITATNGVTGHTIAITGGSPVVTFTMTDSTTHNVTGVVHGTPQTTNASGQAVFGPNLPDGYYVLVETGVPTGYQGAAPSLVRLPLTNAQGEFNYNVHVYPKNISTEDIALKTFDNQTKPVSNGDIITFDLKGRFVSDTVTSAADLKSGTRYGLAEIRDIFAPTFQYVPNSLTVHFLDTDGDIIATALPAGHFNITQNPAAPPAAGGELHVRLTEAGIDAAIAANATGFALRLQAEYIGTTGQSGAPVVNTMQAIFVGADQGTQPPIVTPPGVIPPGVTPPPVVIVELPSINITVDKTTSAATNNAPLAGVVFAIAKVPVPTVNYVPGTPAGSFTATELAAFAANYVVDATGVPVTGTTGADGKIEFNNVDGYADAELRLYLKELVTVPGYQLKPNTIEVIFSSKADYQTASPSWFTNGNWNAGVKVTEGATVVNYSLDENDPDDPGFSLPLTGGAGTLAFTSIGIVVMLGAIVVYLRGKKKNI